MRGGGKRPERPEWSDPADLEGAAITGPDLEKVDFGLDELPGPALHDVLRRFRESAPVAPARFLGLPAFVITSHQALLEAFLDTERFPPHLMYRAAFEPAIGESFISTPDPERHRVYRKLATPAFRSRAVDSYAREGLAALAHELVDAFEAGGRIELMEAYAARFPYLVITRFLGMPREREDEFHDWALSLLRFRDDPAQAARAREELTRFLEPVLAERRREPRDDVISALLQSTVDGRALSDEEIHAHVRLLFPTGGETTHGSLGNLLWALLTRGRPPGAEVCAKTRRAHRLEAAVDEMLPLGDAHRGAAADVARASPCEFHGVEIPASSWVLFAIAGANRDPAIHADPDRFDPARASKESLTFGRGVKSCPGMHLARKNLSVALQVLAERLGPVELDDVEAALPRRAVLRCPDALRVRRAS